MSSEFYIMPYNGCNHNHVLMIAAVVVITLFILSWYAYYSSPNLCTTLTNCGWVVYYMQGCGYCDSQKTVLKNSFSRYVEFDGNKNLVGGYTTTPPVPVSEISGFPTWVNTRTGNVTVGMQDEKALWNMTRQ
jgi:hypothetical protein